LRPEAVLESIDLSDLIGSISEEPVTAQIKERAAGETGPSDCLEDSEMEDRHVPLLGIGGPDVIEGAVPLLHDEQSTEHRSVRGANLECLPFPSYMKKGEPACDHGASMCRVNSEPARAIHPYVLFRELGDIRCHHEFGPEA
jgi:hypothetical protein